MNSYKEVDGDLITLAKEGMFNVIAHGCNCHCTMGAGIAPQMVKAFGVDKFPMELHKYKGWVNKLGNIDFKGYALNRELLLPDRISRLEDPFTKGADLIVVNAYTQYNYGGKKSVDYAAIELCMKKINHIFKGKTIGLPKIGAGLAGGDWNRIKGIIQTSLKDCNVIVVNYKP